MPSWQVDQLSNHHLKCFTIPPSADPCNPTGISDIQQQEAFAQELWKAPRVLYIQAFLNKVKTVWPHYICIAPYELPVPYYNPLHLECMKRTIWEFTVWLVCSTTEYLTTC
ncbi:hypothetical protein GDO81_021918 [Engystomops pustulosus]|uniref:Uncharacterized protein n=1 Tax=Engystomops pustulosus TaxID=76066 RepID=A0AAV6ZUL9_ENGPU|nr:hypothetical protein GDO81_021918 [Engystomops pustulosus]